MADSSFWFQISSKKVRAIRLFSSMDTAAPFGLLSPLLRKVVVGRTGEILRFAQNDGLGRGCRAGRRVMVPAGVGRLGRLVDNTRRMANGYGRKVAWSYA